MLLLVGAANFQFSTFNFQLGTTYAQFQEPVKFAVKQQKLSDTELEIVFTGKVDAGWHVYSTDIPDGGPTKAELTLEKQKGLKTKGALRTTGKVHRAMDDLFGMELSYMEGTASFSQKFTLTGGDYEVAGYLTYGACNDENCIPPTNVEFSFKGKTEDAEKTERIKNEGENKLEEENNEENLKHQEELEDTASVSSVSSALSASSEELWTPVIDEHDFPFFGLQRQG